MLTTVARLTGEPAESRRKIDLGSWHAGLAKAKLGRASKAIGVLVIAHLGTREIRTTRKKLAAAMGVPERTLGRHLPQLEGAGLIQIVQHHDPKTGWHTDSTYRITLPVAADAAVADAASPAQLITTCLSQGAESGTEAPVPKMAEHLAVHWLPIDGTPGDDDGVAAANAAAVSRPPVADAIDATVIRPANWGRDLLAAKARLMVRLPDPDVDDDACGEQTFVPLDTGGQQSDSQCAGGAA
jgi:DNA-binding transcriptional ArsR family regulator